MSRFADRSQALDRCRSFGHRDYRVVSYLDEDRSRALVDAVLDGTAEREKVFRDNWRTLSARIRFDDAPLLLKVPRARNGRRWERFLTLFRQSDALRTFRHLELMSAMGFVAPTPVLACERRQRRVVTDAFVCYRFVEGRAAEPRDAPQIVAALERLHAQGYLRNDPQLANFVVSGDDLCFIDFRLKKPRVFPALRKARELAGFLRSCPSAERFLPTATRTSGWFWLALRLERLSLWFRLLKKRLRQSGKSA